MAGCAVGAAQGWNIDYLALVVRLVVSTGSSFWGWVEESGVSGGWCLARCWVLKARAFFAQVFQCGPCLLVYCFPVGVVALVCVGFRPYFENYTVDASIFVAKFLRAHGGCLGTRNRRRT
jgi:hypothetical protein